MLKIWYGIEIKLIKTSYNGQPIRIREKEKKSYHGLKLKNILRILVSFFFFFCIFVEHDELIMVEEEDVHSP